MVLAFIVAAAITDTQTTAQTLYKKSQAAVVTINTPTMAGTGFIVGDGSLVLTCYHVVKASPEAITVKGFGHAILVRSDPQCDIAVLGLTKRAPVHLKIAKGPAPSPGAQVYVIGSPLGVLEKSITEGTLSGVRHVGDRALLQITAPISHGSSGSPVLDRDGVVIGMAAATLESGQGLNFAVSAFNLRQNIALPTIKKGAASKSNWKAEDTVVTLVHTVVTEKMDVRAKQVYSARKGEAFDVAKTKFPEWLSVQFVDGSIGYLPKEDVRHASTEEIDLSNRELMPTPEVSGLIKALDDPERRVEATRKLVAIGDKALEYLAFELRKDDGDGGVKLQLIVALSEFGSKAKTVLLTMLRDGNRYERVSAIEALEEIAYKLKDSVEPLPKEEARDLSALFLDQGIVNVVTEALEEGITHVSAANIVCKIGMSEAHDKLVALLSGEDVEADSSLVSALAAVAKPEDRELLSLTFLDLLREALKNGDKEDPTYNLNASSLLDGLTDAKNETATEILTALLDDENELIRFLACDSIEFSERTDLLQSVETLLDDISLLVKARALKASLTLRRSGYTERIVDAAKSPDLYTRRIAVQCAAINQESKVVDAILPLASDKEVRIRLDLIETMAVVGGAKGTTCLQQLAKDPDPSVRKAAKEALQDLVKNASSKKGWVLPVKLHFLM